MSIREEIAAILNKHSKENGSNTPDWILAEYLLMCLDTFDGAVNARETWYGRKQHPNSTNALMTEPDPFANPPEGAHHD